MSDFESKMGAAKEAQVRSEAVSVTAYSVLSRSNTSYQPGCTGVSVVRDEEDAGSNSATLRSSAGYPRNPNGFRPRTSACEAADAKLLA